MLDIWEYTNSELEEMGIPLQCECLSTYREIDEHGNVYNVCVDCGAALKVKEKFQW